MLYHSPLFHCPCGAVMPFNSSPLPCSILLLAGGRGQRMGGLDKGLLDWIAPANVTFELPGAPFCTDHTAAFVAALKEANLSLCYNFDAQAAQVFGSGAAFRFIAAARPSGREARARKTVRAARPGRGRGACRPARA